MSAGTRDKIIQAAAACFAQKGYSACAMRDIVERSGMSKGAIYGHFATKEDLFKAMIAIEHEDGAAKSYKACQTPPYLEGIIAFMKECVQNPVFPMDHRLWIEILAVTARDPEMKNTFKTSESMARGFFQQLLIKGIESGEIDPELDVEGMAIMLFALGDGLIARIADDPAFDAKKYFAALETMLRRTLKNPEND